ncbi:replication endonuclease [Rhodoferax sp. WC2427]|uniref:replication endonuclease n=1 Tax=Rhodoferax sp. WC2427 TaxID=3234144 RepID=UPI0034652D0D
MSWHEDAQKLRAARVRAAAQLPGDWLRPIEREARAARTAMGWPSDIEARAVWERWIGEYGGAAAADMSDGDIKRLAETYERDARDLDLGTVGRAGPWAEYARILDFCAHREVGAPGPGYLLPGIAARVSCRYWWRRAIRKMVAQKAERGAMSLGLVSKPANQPYASNKAVFRRLDQNKRNAAALENTVMENEDGQRATLAELAARSTAKKSIRRGELMTRIRGCEVIADEMGMPGVFLTGTCPSRYHSTLRNGDRNPKHDGSNPREAQAWLRLMWSRTRAKLKRDGVDMFGFRVAEPHHDGCPHWHLLIWARDDAAIDSVVEVMRAHWLSDDGEEPGAKKYRVNSKRMEGGGAAGYIAKYIAKNIDDVAIDSHIDDYADGPINRDLIGDMEITPSMRVEAWASTWGIRQFQPLGQPPVTVWRELRRVSEAGANAAGRGGIVHRAWVAAQGVDGIAGTLDPAGRAQRIEAEGRASWADYIRAQGGVMVGRAYKLCIATEPREIAGRYGSCVRKVPMGVRLNWPGTRCVFSERRAWRFVERGSVSVPALEPVPAGAQPLPRTRVNNCTPGTPGRVDRNAHNRVRVVHKVQAVEESGPDFDYFRALERLRVLADRRRDAVARAG